MEIHLKYLGQKVRMHRTAAGTTQEEFCARCGIAKTYLSRIERGIANPSLAVLVALADTLEVPVADLLIGN